MKKRSTGRPRTNPIPPRFRDEEPSPPPRTVLEHVADDADLPMPDSAIFGALGLDQAPPNPPPKRRPMTKRELVAYHEFAHVFVGTLYGMKATHASIESRCRGKGAHVAGRTRFEDDDADFESLDWCRSFATICLAGDAAEHVLTGKRNCPAGSMDHRLAVRALQKECFGDEHMLSGLMQFLFYRVRLALLHYWDVVEFGAEKLLKKGSLTESEIEEIIFDGEHPCHSAA